MPTPTNPTPIRLSIIEAALNPSAAARLPKLPRGTKVPLNDLGNVLLNENRVVGNPDPSVLPPANMSRNCGSA